MGLGLSDEFVILGKGISGSLELYEGLEGSRLFITLQTGDLVIFPKLHRAFRNTHNAQNILLSAIVFSIISVFVAIERERRASRILKLKQLNEAKSKLSDGKPHLVAT